MKIVLGFSKYYFDNSIKNLSNEEKVSIFKTDKEHCHIYFNIDDFFKELNVDSIPTDDYYWFPIECNNIEELTRKENKRLFNNVSIKTIKDVENYLSLLSSKEKQLLKDTIICGAWGDTDNSFLIDENNSNDELCYVYVTNDAYKRKHFVRKELSNMFRSIYGKLCNKNGIGEIISHCSDWWGDGSGDVLFIKSPYYKIFENWATK